MRFAAELPRRQRFLLHPQAKLLGKGVLLQLLQAFVFYWMHTVIPGKSGMDQFLVQHPAHSVNKKVYITANILPPNRKIESFQKSLAYFAEAKPDAFIMADPGMIRFVLKEFPEIPVHLSVQTNTINWSSVQFWQDLGVERIILSRELSLAEIEDIHQHVPEMELESFVHGAICIAYSGRCLLSNYFNHRDANQGTCTNSCRWEYDLFNQADEKAPLRSTHNPDLIKGDYYLEEKQRPGELMPIDEDEYGTYIMNSKDLRAIEFLRQLRDAGICSFKIEGRSKTIYYLSVVVRNYRRAIDDMAKGMKFDPQLIEEINKTANRGFTSAFLIANADHETERFDSPQEDQLPQVFAGQVKGERDGGWMEVEVKNRIEVGDELEYIAPGGQRYFKIEASKIKRANRLPLRMVATVAFGFPVQAPWNPSRC